MDTFKCYSTLDNKEFFLKIQDTHTPPPPPKNVLEIVKCWFSYALLANDKLMDIFFMYNLYMFIFIIIKIARISCRCRSNISAEFHISFAVCIVDRSYIEEIYGNPQNSQGCPKTVIKYVGNIENSL